MHFPRTTTALFSTILLLFLLAIAVETGFSDVILPHYHLHMAIETLGAFSVMLFACLLLASPETVPDPARCCIASGLVVMGILSIFHLLHPLDNTAVWLHNLATLTCSILFSSVWLTEIPAFSRNISRLPGIMLLVALAIGIASLLLPETLPANLSPTGFSTLSYILNFISSILFFTAAGFFILRNIHQRDDQSLYYGYFCALLGFAAMVFNYSSIYNPTWWLWHIIRIIAFVIILSIAYANYHRKSIALRQVNEILNRQSKELTEQVNLLQLSSNIGMALNMPTSLDEILRQCTLHICRRLGVVSCAIYLRTNQQDNLEQRAGYPAEKGNQPLLLPDDHPICRVMRAAKLQVLDLHRDDDSGDAGPRNSEAKRFFAGFPLFARQSTTGVMAVYSKHPLSDRAVSVLTSCADAISQGIEKKIVEEELLESEEKFRSLVENSSDWIWEVDANGLYTYASSLVTNFLGYQPEEVIGRSPFDFMPPEEVLRVRAIFQEIFTAGKAFSILKNRNIHKDGHEVILETSGVPFFDHQGNLAGYRGVDRDVTKHGETEKQLIRLAAAIENAAEEIVITDPDGIIEYVNPAFERINGYTASEAIGGSPNLLKSGRQDRKFYQELWDTIANGKTWQGHLSNKHKDGRLIEIEATISPIFDQDRNIIGFVSVKRDVTANFELEKRLRQAQKMEAIGTLAGGIAHDFNNLLNVINGFTTLVLMDLPTDGTIAEDLREIQKATKRASGLVQQILAFSRRKEEAMLPLELQSITKEVIKLLRGTLPATITIRQKIAACPPVLADATQIHQVLMNICTNAYHAMRETGGTLTIGLEETTLEPENPLRLKAGRYARLDLTDTGYGIDPNNIERIFEPYFTTKNPHEGTGLGLSTSHGIIKNHNGEIIVQSRPGTGTTFTIFLPLVLDETALVMPMAEKNLQLDRITANILFVDDVEFNTKLGSKILEKSGCTVTPACSGQEAMQIFLTSPDDFDLIITDQTMPGMTGFELARRLLTIRPDLPIIMVTGHSDLVNEAKAKEIGIREFLMKPLQLEVLIRAVQKALGPHNLSPEPRQQATKHEEPDMTGSSDYPGPAELANVTRHLATTYNLSEEKIAALLQGAALDLDKMIRAGREHIVRADWQQLASTLHTMKGILLNLGLNEWSNFCLTVEKKIKNTEDDDYTRYFEEIGKGLNGFITTIQQQSKR